MRSSSQKIGHLLALGGFVGNPKELGGRGIEDPLHVDDIPFSGHLKHEKILA
jgi:hypothetical protein